MAWQQGITALLLYQVQTVTPARLSYRGTCKDRRSSFYVQVFYCMRRQQAVYFMVMLLPYQNQSQKTGNHQATGITAHMGCKFGK